MLAEAVSGPIIRRSLRAVELDSPGLATVLMILASGDQEGSAGATLGATTTDELRSIRTCVNGRGRITEDADQPERPRNRFGYLRI